MKVAYCLFKDQFQHIQPVEKACENTIKFIYDAEWNFPKIKELNPDIVVSINEHHLKIAECYEQAQQLNIPTLTLQDGVLEWRYLFENPMFSGNDSGIPLHQPIIADKYACIGPWWAHLIAAMGNKDKVEVTGMPKMDGIENQIATSNKKNTGAKTIMVMTAAKPWFEEVQKPTIITMLQDLKTYFDSRKDINVIWRVTKLLDKDLKVEGAFNKKESTELLTQLNKCDAVISTVSTAMIETLLMGKPLAKLDYFNSPSMFPTVWSITHRDQIDQTVNSLLSTKQEQCFTQELFKYQVISHIGNASKMVADLMLKMIEYKQTNPDKKLPSNMLQHASAFDNPSSLPQVYPDRQALIHQDIDWLKAKLVRLEWENQLLKQEASKFRLSKLLVSLYHKIQKN